MGSIAKTKPVRKRLKIGDLGEGSELGGCPWIAIHSSLIDGYLLVRVKCRLKCYTQIWDLHGLLAACKWGGYGKYGMVSGRMSLEISDPTSRVPPLSHPRDRFIAVSPKNHLIILMMHPGLRRQFTVPRFYSEPGPLRSSHRSPNVWQLPF